MCKIADFIKQTSNMVELRVFVNDNASSDSIILTRLIFGED